MPMKYTGPPGPDAMSQIYPCNLLMPSVRTQKDRAPDNIPAKQRHGRPSRPRQSAVSKIAALSAPAPQEHIDLKA